MLSFLNAIGRARTPGSFSPPSLPVFALPQYFPWTPDFQIFELQDGRYSCSYDPAVDKPSGTALIIDPVNGNDGSADGSAGAPYQTLAAAYNAGGDILNIKSGWIDENIGFTANFNPNRDLAIVAIDGPGTVHLTRSLAQSSITWVQENAPNTNVYKASGVSGIRSALDLTYGRDGVNATLENQKDGASALPIPYSVQTSIADVQANAGSYYDDGTDIYIHTHDVRAPDSDIKLLKAENITSINSDITLYIEGLEIWGDNSLSFNVGNTANAKFIGVDMACRFTGDGDDCFNFDDLSDIRLVRCSASDNMTSDGFNYHRNVGGNGARSRILEWDCDARRNGETTSDIDNGTTTHDGVRCIRLNGIYEYNYGPNVGDTSGAQVINLNCQGNHAQAANTYQKTGFLSGSYSGDEATVVYLKGCSAVGNTFDRARSTGGQMLDLGGFTGDAGDNGTVLDGTDPFYDTIATIAPDALNGFYSVLESQFYDNQSGEIDDFFDASPFKSNLSTPGTRPAYDAANTLAGGLPAADFGSATNGHIFDPAKSSTVKEVIIACAYKDGTDSSFDDAITIMTNASGGNKISGTSGAATLDGAGVVSTVSKNGGAASATMLPGGFAVYRFTLPSAINEQHYFFGELSQATRSWQGPVGLLLTSKRDLTTTEFNGMLSAIQTKFSIA